MKLDEILQKAHGRNSGRSMIFLYYIMVGEKLMEIYTNVDAKNQRGRQVSVNVVNPRGRFTEENSVEFRLETHGG